MRPPLLERIKARLCRWFGHRTADDGYVAWCRRCLLVLAASPKRRRGCGDPECTEDHGTEPTTWRKP